MKRLTPFLLLLFYAGRIFAQSPGGIDSPVLWFQTSPVGADLNGAYRWQDVSGNALRLQNYSTLPSNGSEFQHGDVRFINGHAALPFSPLLSPSKVAWLNQTALSQTTISGVFAPSAHFFNETLLYGFNGRPQQGLWLGSDRIYHSIESDKGAFDYGQTEGMDLMHSNIANSMRIVNHYYSILPATGIWGESPKSTFTFGNYTPANTTMTSTYEIPNASNQMFTGYIPEFIVYNRRLSPLERRKVNSYLAIKYGISLPGSYIGSNGQLLWDYSANSTYNHRITGLYRDDASGLNQLESSTSYEENNYSYANDFYYNNLAPTNFSKGNPYGRTTSQRLLTIAREYGYEPANQSYLLWSDDNQSISDFSGLLYQFGLEKMERNWRVSTNDGNYNPAMLPDWISNDLVIYPDFENFSTRIVLYASAAILDQSAAFTSTSLSGKTGYLNADWNYKGNLYLKFGGNSALLTPNSHDYGYCIQTVNDSGYVYPVIRGTVSTTSVATITLYSRLEVEKDENQVRLRVNGIFLPATTITINAQDKNQSFFGGIGLTQEAFDNRITIREGGFCYTGNRIELSYDDNCAPDFAANTGGQGSVLLINRQGMNHFNAGNVEIFEATETDTLRKKIIFNNVRLRNGNVFSFARRESNLYGMTGATGSSCYNDGEINCKIVHGCMPFTYTLYDAETGDVVGMPMTEWWGIHYFESLHPGSYIVRIEEGKGFSFRTVSNEDRAKTANPLSGANGSIEWVISNEIDMYWIGFTTDEENIYDNVNQITYGINKIYNSIFADGGDKMFIAVGDTIKMVKNYNTITYFQNGQIISTTPIDPADQDLNFYGLIQPELDPPYINYCEIFNVQTEGFPMTALADWDRTECMDMQKGWGSSVEYEVTVDNECSHLRSAEAGQEEDSGSESLLQAADPHFSVYIRNGNRVKTHLELSQAEAASLAVYAANGAEIKLIENAVPQKIHENEFSLPANGTYIIKVITATEEFTKKIITH
ncbi:MAG: T9SS type A sorting domain-containing protein [Dysgonamonadaceae bacterium]|jgi:hypothetical protein|nr:T9SS type A sorting domain-containing protein [Dysgonamonadaceae bacterium]